MNKTPESSYILFKAGETDKNGELLASPQSGRWQQKSFVIKNYGKQPLASGDIFLGKFKKTGDECLVKPFTRIGNADQIESSRLFGIVERQNHICIVNPVEKSGRPQILTNEKKLKTGDFVEIEVRGAGRYKETSLVKNYGPYNLEMINEVLIGQKYKIPRVFSPELLNECKRLPDFENDNRDDCTAIPFVTIDGEDSKDFDDAVYATRTAGGFRLMVAIADVSFYVRPETRLDREAYLRGNSVYLPRTVIPMLPEILSNNLCSLTPKTRRPAIVCTIEIDRNGKMLEWHFARAVIKSIARLTYREVENAINGEFNATTKKFFTTAIQPLYEAYFALEKARQIRGTLELETGETKIKFAKDGQIIGIENISNLTSNKIIEEFMIAANVAAARFLQARKIPALYRIHDKPHEEKIQEIKPLLKCFNLKLPDYPALKPQHFNKILQFCHAQKGCCGMDDLILRLQCQAQYSPDNIGHFGLNLKEYVHFTSPIRRYADLLIHRDIVYACKMAPTPPMPLTAEQLRETGDHLGVTERRAAAAERDITARYLALYMQPMIGSELEVTITGLTNAGIFVRVESICAEGLIPMGTLPKDYYQLLDAGSCLRGCESKIKFHLGDAIHAILTEAVPVTGGLIFHYLPPAQPEKGTRKTSRPKAKKTSRKTASGKSKKAQTPPQKGKKT